MLNSNSSRAILTQARDNSAANARAIGNLNGSRKFRGSVGRTDKVDFYSFTLSGRSSFNLSLNKLKNNVDVFLLQGSQVIGRSTRKGKKSEAIATNLEAGTYFVRINRKSGNSPYQLTLNATPSSGSGTNPPGSRRLVSIGLQPTVPLPKYGLIDLSTGIFSELPLNNPFSQGTLVDMAASGNDIYGVDILSSLYKYDSSAGIATRIGSLGGSTTGINFLSLGFGANGTLYTIGTTNRTRVSGLYTVDLAAGGKTNLVADLPGIVDVGDIAYDAASGRFFASGSSSGTGNSILYSIGLNGEVRSIGDMGFSNVGALLFENGILYGFDSALSSSQKLLVFDTNTGAGRVDKAVTRNNEPWGYITGGG
jgi:Bacterial pre-peptidase C-terminal domain